MPIASTGYIAFREVHSGITAFIKVPAELFHAGLVKTGLGVKSAEDAMRGDFHGMQKAKSTWR